MSVLINYWILLSILIFIAVITAKPLWTAIRIIITSERSNFKKLRIITLAVVCTILLSTIASILSIFIFPFAIGYLIRKNVKVEKVEDEEDSML